MNAPTFVEFVEGVLGLQLTPGQHVLCSVAFDGVQPKQLPRAERKIARELFGELDRVPSDLLATVVIVAGARSGKSYLGALRLLHLALVMPLDRLAPGEIAVAVIVAPDLRLARQPMRYALGAVESTPALRPMLVSRTEDGFVLRRPDGKHVSIECLPATRGGSALRGRTLVGALLDETAFFRDADFQVNDRDVLAAVAPRVLSGGQVVIGSTPWGETGLLFELYKENFGGPSTALVAHAPTLRLRDDRATKQLVARERARDPRNAAREYDAVFASSDDALLDSVDVDNCVDRGIKDRPIEPGVAYSLGLDLGIRHDSSGWVRVHREIRTLNGAQTEVTVVDRVAEYRPKWFSGGRVKLEQVEEDLSREAHAAKAKVLHDVHLADALTPRLKTRGVRSEECSMSSAEQARRATLLAMLIREGRLVLVDHPELVKQLKELRVTRHSGGRVTIAAPRGRSKHDDLADALLLAVDGAQRLAASNVSGVECIPEQLIWRGNPGLSEVRPARYFRRSPDGSVIPCAPPPGTRDHYAAQAARFERGVATPEDVAELGDDEVARRQGINVPVRR